MILATSNLEPDSDEALLTAAELARLSATSLTVLHCLKRPQFPQSLSQVQEVEALEAAQQMLCEQLGRTGLLERATPMVRPGPAGKTIVEVAEELSASMITLGPHRPRSLFSELLGSTGDYILRTAPAPCLIANQHPHMPPRRVLATTDFSLASLESVRLLLGWLKTVAEGSTTVVELLYVHTGKENEDSPVEVSLQSHLHEATAQLELPANIKLRERVLLAPAVYEGIRRAAEEMRTDLVVLGTHGHNFVARLIIGSVTTACSRHLPFPLLVVPARTTVATESPS